MKINPSYTIYMHMETVSMMKVRGMPYGNLITKLMKMKGIQTLSVVTIPNMFYKQRWFDCKHWKLKHGRWVREAKAVQDDDELADNPSYFFPIAVCS